MNLFSSVVVILVCSIGVVFCEENFDVFRIVQMYVSNGNFTEAEKFIDTYLLASSQTISLQEQQKLLFEKERLRRIRLDYKKTYSDLLAELNKKILNFREEELRIWDELNLIDSRIINGQTFYFNSAVSNLFFRNKDVYYRRIGWKNLEEEIRKQFIHCKSLEKMFKQTNSPLLQGTTFVITFTITVPENTLQEGTTVRCWMPFPIEFPRQKNIVLISANPLPLTVKYQNTDIGYLYFEQRVEKNKPVIFEAKFKFTSFGYYNKIDVKKIIPYSENDKEYITNILPHTHHEEPFPELVKLTKEIVKNEKNPYIKAKLIYDWITDNFLYSYAPEYSTIENLTRYTFERRYGDCGQQGMLFITMCKIADVAARWQSGWYIDPEDYTMHDWAEIYIPPYGWLPVDVYWGSFVKHYSDLTKEDKKFLSDFYFGNIDIYRFVVNNNHSLEFTPNKKFFRSEIIDFQRGEVETDTENLYFDRFKSRIRIEKL
ncbi:MAG: transglutaminase-like domain-containing protein [Endomicrobia bacterium]|nr:transglutaminase-like domain-containing protein [Endomicrobiia bacterium]MCX7716581.1 transglutaminase-like domain-containing protein [Endomicrobiia bacterium]